MTEFAGAARRSQRPRAGHGSTVNRHATTWDKAAVCTSCHEGLMQRVHRETVTEFLVSCFGFYPFICSNCFGRKYRLKARQLAGAACLVIFTAGLMLIGGSYLRRQYRLRQVREASRLEFASPPAATAQPSATTPLALKAVGGTGSADDGAASGGELLNNQDVVRMVRSGMSTSVICSLIGRAGNRFQLDAGSLEALQKDGVPEPVIAAMKQAAK